MTTQEKWAEKIAALLRKAEQAGPEEAEVFFAKAQELMAKYAIDEAMLAASNPDARRNDPIGWAEFVTVGIYRHALYMIDYYVLLVNGCKPIEVPDSPWRTIDGRTYKETRILEAVGLQSDLDTARHLLTSLKLQCMRAESVWWNEHRHLYEGAKKSEQHQARRGFMFAFGQAAHVRMKEAMAKGKETAEQEHGQNSVALVLRDKSLAVAEAFTDRYPSTRKTKSRISQGDAFARSHGHEAGQRADIGGKRRKNQKEIA